MAAIQADSMPAGDLTIQQVSRLTGLSEWTLRYYEKVGLIDAVARDESSRHRRYDPAAVARIESLAHLRATGLGIDDMRVLMHARGHDPETIETKVGLLTARRDKIAGEIRALRARQRFLENRIAYWQAVQAGHAGEIAQLADRGEALSKHLS
jgi:MerR family transcriptional regulator, aldehyde-responsive regulator